MAEEKYFPSQEPEEKIFLLIRKHWFNYIIFIYVTVLMLVPISLITWYLVSYRSQLSASNAVLLVIILNVLILSTLAVELYGFVSHYLDIYIVTDRRLVDISQDGLFNRKISELQINDIQDVSATVKGIFPTLLHFGNLVIQTAGERENFIFDSIPHPYSVSKQIMDLHEQAIQADNYADANSQKKYSEAVLEKGVETADIEDRAKAALSSENTVHQTQGVYIPEENKTAVKSFTAESDGKIDSNGNHELEEGKETKIT